MRSILCVAFALGCVLAVGGCGEPTSPATSTAPPPAPAAPPPALGPEWFKGSQPQLDEAKRLGVPVAYEEESTGIRFVLIPGGTFQMGSPASEEKRHFHEGPQHAVTLSAFYLSIHETTNAQYKKFKADHESRADGATQPVERVSHEEATAFVAWLDGQGGATGYALPTEAQWEYACRAGSTTRWSFGDDKLQLAEHDWYAANSKGKTYPGGQKRPNAWGLYDMHGNLLEWCADDWHDSYKGAPADGSAWIDSPRAAARVFRGGSLGSPAEDARSAHRTGDSPDFRASYLGFRLARPVAAR